MNKTEEIIKVAIEGGYDKDKTVFSIIPNNEELDGDTGEVMTMFIRSYWLYPKLFLDPLFFQAIGKAKGWLNKTITVYDEIEEYNNPEELQEMINPAIEERMLIVYALEFHRINLTQSFDDAINYLYELIK